MKKFVAIAVALFVAAPLIFQAISTSAQQAGAPQGQPRGGGGRGPGIEALAPDDHTGFESIFDGEIQIRVGIPTVEIFGSPSFKYHQIFERETGIKGNPIPRTI